MKVKRIIWKTLPYCVSILFGLIFLYIGLELSQDYKGLFISIAAAFFAIPLMYLFYQQAANLSQKRLNKEMFDYAKMLIDTDLLSIVKQLQKTVYPFKVQDIPTANTDNFLSLKKGQIRKIMSENEYLGFQILKKWEISLNNLHNALQNSYILRSLENDQIISIISIIKILNSYESIMKFSELDKLYIPTTKKKTTSYRVVSGKEINKESTQFPERYLLMKNLGGNKAQVVDFGDFREYNVGKLLQIYTIDEKALDFYSNIISDLIDEINIWLNLTGTEFVVNPQMFRFGYGRKIEDFRKRKV